MNTKWFGGLLGLALLAILLVLGRNFLTKSAGPTPQPKSVSRGATATDLRRADPPDTRAKADPAAAVTPLKPPQDVLWNRPVTEPKFAAFAEWTRRYALAAPGEKAALEAEGLPLARARLTAMADMVQLDPERALELAVPHTVRQAMPDSVKALLETSVNTRADYEVQAFLPVPGSEDGMAPVLRFAATGEQRYQVFTFGKGLRYLTKPNVPVNGIAVGREFSTTPPPANGLPASPFLLALDPNPARVLDQSEVADIRKERPAEPFCSVSGQAVTLRGDETIVQFGGELQNFCAQAHAAEWVAAHVAALGLETFPPPESTTANADRTYTQGRKRLLLMRPIFTDLANTTIPTNQVLGHFLSFSNYIYEMSYGKLVFAGLGRGSDATPEMVLPGVVADYDGTGLGKLYQTCRSVAQTNYGYDLSQYDFLYVCTASRPSAGYSGLGFVGSVGFHLANSAWGSSTASHEFGHNLGLNHAHFWNTLSRTIVGYGLNVEYGDTTDPMGSGGSPNQFNSRYKNYLNWIPDSDIADLNVTRSGLYRLYAFDLNEGVGLRGLKFTRNSSQNYWVQFRQRKSGQALQNGVQLLWTGDGNESSYLLDTRLNGDASDGAIVVGRTFSDSSLGLHITPIGPGHTSPESIDVVVNIGTFPTNLPPSALIRASATSAPAGQLIRFTAAATDPNGDTLAYYFEFGDGDYSVENSPTTAHSFGAAGEYVVRCTVSDMKGGTARDSVLVRMGSPSSGRITGRVLATNGLPVSGMKVFVDSSHFGVTDSDGTYAITGLTPGSYKIDIVEPVAGNYTFAHPFFNNPVTVTANVTADFIGLPPAPNMYSAFVAKKSNWKYYDDGADPGTAWKVSSFNDASWSSGPGVLGYGTGNEATRLGFGPDANNKFITSYFRRLFVVSDPSLFHYLLLETLRDDGAIAYLNGIEVYRDSMPAGTANYTTRASASTEPAAYFPVKINPNLLVAGNNILAVEVHQNSPSSDDVAFDAALSGLAAELKLVYVSAPSQHAVFTSPTNVMISATATGQVQSVNLVEFFADGANIGQSTAAPYQSVWPNPPLGQHTLAVVATFSGGSQFTSAPVTINVAAPTSAPPLVSLSLSPLGSTWKYLAAAAGAPAAWASFGFNDASWLSGRAQLGYGESDEITTLPFGGNANNKWITYYFRRAFTVNDPAGVTDLAVRLLRDDGGIVYLNGVEIFRSNMPEGTVNYLTLASDASDDGKDFFASVVDPVLLRPGTNILAVEIHQESATSSDVSFDLALDALSFTNRPRGLWLTAPVEGAFFPLPGSVPLAAHVVAGGSLGVLKVEFFADGTKIAEDITSPYSVVWNGPPSGAHTLTAVATDTANGSITGAPVHITVGPPPLATALISLAEEWKYRDDGSNQGTNWTSRVFDDSSWLAGPAKLGYGGAGEITTVSYGTNANAKFITTYFRKTFTVDNPSLFSGVLLRLIRDAGAVVHLNGSEVFRDNLPSGRVSWNSLALVPLEGAAETTPVEAVLNASLLRSGTNVIAVEIHQTSRSGSDLGFDLALLGLNETNTLQGVYLSSPANGAQYLAPASIPLNAFAAAAAPVTLVEYFDGSTKLGQATTVPYSFAWGNGTIGVHQLTARATYGAGLVLTSAPVTITIASQTAPIMPVSQRLVTAGSSWKFWDNTVAVGAAWAEPGFDDRTWPSGPARFGFGLDGEATTLTSGRITCYFRRSFTVANPALFTELLFQLARDDGAVVYLNGREVFRDNMPPGAVGASTLASSTIGTPDETTYFESALAAAGAGLLTGSNVVAVELHQASATSSDAGFDLQLSGFGTTEARIYLTTPADGALLRSSAPIALEAAVNPAANTSVSKVEFFADGAKLSESLAAPYRYTWSQAPGGPHTLGARATLSNGTVLDSAEVSVLIVRELLTTTLIPSNSVWKYLDNGSNLGTSWAQRTYNDNAWAMGPARLGYGNDGEATPVSFGANAANKYITTYFRRRFVVPEGDVYTSLTFLLARDDGAVVWLNGREVFRSNMPAGAITFTSLAVDNANDAEETTFFSTAVATTNVVFGTNVVAVEVHQSAANSSDLGFNLQLIGVGYGIDIPPPMLAATLANGLVALSWPATATGWRVYAALDVTAPDNAWLPLAGTPTVVNGRNIVTVTPTLEARFFRLGKP